MTRAPLVECLRWIARPVSGCGAIYRLLAFGEATSKRKKMDTNHDSRLKRPTRYGRGTCLAALVLLALAACARLVYLAEFPSFIHNDESGIAVFVVPPFLEFPPQSPLWGFTFYGGHGNFDGFLSSIPALITGSNDLWALRLGSALSGILSIALFALALNVSFGCRVALFFTAAVIPFHLHVHYSRTGFPYIHAVLLTGALTYAFSRFAHKPMPSRAFIVGLCLGFALMVYSATYVLPVALGIGFLGVVCSSKFRDIYSRQRAYGALKLVVSLVGGTLCALGPQLVYVYQKGFTSASRLHSQTLWSGESSNHGIDALVRGAERFGNQLIRTLEFFYRHDGAAQGSGPLLTTSYYQYIAAFGLIVMLVHLAKGSAVMWFLVTAGVSTVLGSALMIEANFSPHLIIFSLLTPLAFALALDAVCTMLRLRSVIVTAVLLMVCSVPWAWWNYLQIKDFDQRKSSINTWFLRLPTDREEVLQVVNLSRYYADVGESMYRVMYPKATMSKVAVDDPIQHVSSLISNKSCPCVVLVENDREDALKSFLRENNRYFDTFVHEKRFGVAFFIR